MIGGLFAIYRFFDAAGELLYVGQSISPGSRFRQHQDTKTWWQQVASITLEHFESAGAMAAAERAAVRAESPRHNLDRFLTAEERLQVKARGGCYTGPGRPEIGGKVQVRLGDLLTQVDAGAAAHGIDSRADAVRQLVARALDAETAART